MNEGKRRVVGGELLRQQSGTKRVGPGESLRYLVRWAAGALLLVAGASPVYAAKYYVDAAHGSDTANGMSPQTAWQHLSAVNRLARERGFQPGDAILLKRGERWHEQLELLNQNASGPLPNSGTAASPITITGYGAGDLPTIDAADTIGQWTKVAPGVFKAAVQGPVYKVFVDGEQRQTEPLQTQPNFRGVWAANTAYAIWDSVTTGNGRTYSAMNDVAPVGRFNFPDWYHAPDLTAEQQTSGLANVTRVPGSWYVDTTQGVVFVHLPDGSDPARHTIQVTRRRYGVELEGVNHLVVDGLRVIHAGKSGILAAVYAPNNNGAYMTNEYNTVRRCVFWNESDISDDVLPGTRMFGEGALFVAASGKDNDKPLRGWLVEGNAVGAIDSEKLTNFNRSGFFIAGTDGLVMRANYVATNDAMGTSIVTDRAPRCVQPLIQSNYFTSNQGNLRISGCTNAVVDSNTIAYSYGYGIQTGGDSPGPMITHNLIYDLTVTPDGKTFNGLDCNGGAPGGTLAYNTISSVWAAEATLEIGCDHWSVHDNVFDSSNNAQHGGLTLYIRRESLPGMTFANNTYDVDPNVKRQFNVGAGLKGALTFHDYAWWQQNMEQSAHVTTQAFVARDADEPRERRSAEAVAGLPGRLPVKPFAPTEASGILLRDAPKAVWQADLKPR